MSQNDFFHPQRLLPAPPNEPIPGYTLWEKTGEGKWGIVFKARQHSLGRWVTIKVIHPAFVNAQIIEKFAREIQSFGKLSHPHILHALDSGQIGDIHFLVMEYFDGSTLTQYIRANGHIAEAEALQIGYKILTALCQVWQQGMIHRDIVPDNIMVSQGEVKLCDLGLVRELPVDDLLTPYPMPTASYAYLSPEQLRGHHLDYRSDVYSLGAVLYHAVTGHPPLENWDLRGNDHSRTQIPLPRRYRPSIDQAVEALLLRMLAYEPKDRCDSPAALRRSLGQLSKRLAPGSTTAYMAFRHQWVSQSQFWEKLLALLLMVAIIFLVLDKGQSWYQRFHAHNRSSGKLTPAAIYTKCVPGVVILEAGELLGGGVLISYRGNLLILTNQHLIRDAQQVQVTFQDGRKCQAKVLASHNLSDLTVVLPPPELSNDLVIAMAESHSLHVGDDVFAIGHPKGYRWSLVRGTVSGLRDETIQTDAAIYPGNSGGPLLDGDGQMVGIITFVVGSGNPIGFAISVVRIRAFLDFIVTRYADLLQKQ